MIYNMYFIPFGCRYWPASIVIEIIRCTPKALRSRTVRLFRWTWYLYVVRVYVGAFSFCFILCVVCIIYFHPNQITVMEALQTQQITVTVKVTRQTVTFLLAVSWSETAERQILKKGTSVIPANGIFACNSYNALALIPSTLYTTNAWRSLTTNT